MADSLPDEPSGPKLNKKRVVIPRTMTQRIRTVMDTVVEESVKKGGRLRRRIMYPLYVARVLLQVVRLWVRDRCPQQASSLAFQTALSLVPLIAIGLFLLRVTGAFGAESTLVNYLAGQVLPVSRQEIAQNLLKWAGNLSFETAGIAGFVTTLILSYFMYASVEQIFNDIWRVDRRRSWLQKFVVFYVIVTIVPLFFGFSLYQAARLRLTQGAAGVLGSMGVTWVAFFCMNKLLPRTRVRWKPAVAGALVSALGFELAKQAFQLYVTRVAFQKYSGIYGTLGLVPITLIWIYYSWLVILFGAEVAHTVQNLQHLESMERRAHANVPVEAQVSGVVAARLLTMIVTHWKTGGLAMPREDIVEASDLDEQAVEQVCRRLREGGLILEVQGDAIGYIPARPPSGITLADVFALFRGSDLGTSGVAPGRSKLDDVLAIIDHQLKDRAGAVTFEDLSG